MEISDQATSSVVPGLSQDWIKEAWRLARKHAVARQELLSQQVKEGIQPQDAQIAPQILVIDEIQKIPQWSEQVKAEWDQDRANDFPLHVVLLGSAPLLIQKGLTESLTGRYELITAKHWSYVEMQEAFDFTQDEYIYFGAYPGAASLIRDEARWRAYVQQALIQPSIEKDVTGLNRIEKPSLLRRLFDLACLYSGQELSYTKMIGQLQDAGNTTTLAHYLQLLDQAGLACGLEKYAGEAVRQRASSPKLCIHNTALATAAANYSFEEAKNDRDFWGRLTESCIGAHLINSLPVGQKLMYWRTSPHEVDFVIEHGLRRLAIEVKSGRTRGHVSGLLKFAEMYPNTRTLVIGDSQSCDMSIAEFLSLPTEDWFDASPSK